MRWPGLGDLKLSKKKPVPGRNIECFSPNIIDRGAVWDLFDLEFGMLCFVRHQALYVACSS